MSKTLKEGEAFIRFLFDVHITRKQVRLILVNCPNIQLKVLTEIFHNLLKNQKHISYPSLREIVKKRKRLISKFISLYKRSKALPQQKFISKHFRLIYLILQQSKKFIFTFLPSNNYK